MLRDVENKYLVGRQHGVIFIGLPVQTLTRDDALVLAAWLVAVADDEEDFPTVLDMVRGG